MYMYVELGKVACSTYTWTKKKWPVLHLYKYWGGSGLFYMYVCTGILEDASSSTYINYGEVVCSTFMNSGGEVSCPTCAYTG
jgi:hypothetical protein